MLPPSPPSRRAPSTRHGAPCSRPSDDPTRRLLADVDKTKSLAFSKVQAAKLLRVLQDFAKRTDLKPADATKMLIEKQLSKVADLAYEEERRKRMQGATGQRPANGCGQNPQGQRPAGANGQNGANGQRPDGLFAAIQNGTPFNPFKEGRPNEQLQALITVLKKR